MQKLMEKYKERSDVQFVTLNMDDNPGLIEPLMRKLGLTLTVIHAYSYVTDTLQVQGIPQNWIVDTEGTIRFKGYDSAGVRWEADMSAAIEKLRPAPAER